MGIRVAFIAGGLGLWYLTQHLLGQRGHAKPNEDGSITDGIHQLTAKLHARMFANPSAANRLLISSSLVIDLLGFFILGSAIVGGTIQPFLGLLIIFGLRQLCQMLCPLPPPSGMIWRYPGMPAILVTYETANDLFFSGHTALAIFGTACLAHALGPIGIVLGFAIAVFEIGTVLILRAHYTMDVFTGAITALYVYQLSWQIAPTIDQWIGQLVK